MSKKSVEGKQKLIRKFFRFAYDSPTLKETQEIIEKLELRAAIKGEVSDDDLREIVFSVVKDTTMMVTEAYDNSVHTSILDQLLDEE